MKVQDKEDKFLDRQRRKEKRIKAKNKLKRGAEEDEDDVEGDDLFESDRAAGQKASKRSKIYFDSDNEDSESKGGRNNIGFPADSISLAQQEELALKLLSSMNG